MKTLSQSRLTLQKRPVFGTQRSKRLFTELKCATSSAFQSSGERDFSTPAPSPAATHIKPRTGLSRKQCKQCFPERTWTVDTLARLGLLHLIRADTVPLHNSRRRRDKIAKSASYISRNENEKKRNELNQVCDVFTISAIADFDGAARREATATANQARVDERKSIYSQYLRVRVVVRAPSAPHRDVKVRCCGSFGPLRPRTGTIVVTFSGFRGSSFFSVEISRYGSYMTHSTKKG